ncbi:MAG: SPOR domain-containing protein [Chitinophagales bacterium]
MNKTLQLVVMTMLMGLLVQTLAHAQTKENYSPQTKNEVTTKTAQTIYKVQIGAYRYPEWNNFEQFYNIGSVYREETKSGLWRIIIGDYATKEESNKTLQLIQNAGYKDAYVFEDKVVVPFKSRKLLNPTTFNTPAESGDLTNSANKNADEAYIIQVAVYSNIDFTNFLDIANVGNIYLEKSNELTKVAVGKYRTQNAAEQALKRLKTLGYTKAFIRMVNVNFGE